MGKTTPQSNAASFLIRLPLKLREPLRDLAWRNRRSMAAELAMILEAALEYDAMARRAQERAKD